jgi:hypothetical protein
MKEFHITERFKLEIRWDKVIYDRDGAAELIGCYFGGPVIKEVADIAEEDRMKLDFSNQYLVFIPYFYIATLHWKGIRRVLDKIYLYNVLLTNDNLNVVPKLNNNDYIVVDTENHEDEKHQYYLVYPSYLIRFDGEKYDFRGK